MRKARVTIGERPVTGATFKLVVRGELDPRVGYLFNGMHVEGVEGTTAITAEVTDQARLHGFIQRIEELGLELLSVYQTSRTFTSPGE
jgi:hypothetical protein